jgi:type II secretion system protein N
MSRILRIIAYAVLFAICFAVFLYWVFPYDMLKDRLLGAVEKGLGEGITLSAKHLEPYWFTGVEVDGLTIEGQGEQGSVEFLKVKRVRVRASFFGLLLGSRKVSFDAEIGKGEMSGSVHVSDEALHLDLLFDKLDLASIPFLQAKTGAKWTSRVDGDIRLDIDRQQPARSTGNIDLTFQDLRLGASQLQLGGMDVALPDLELAKGRDSRIRLVLAKGVMNLEALRLAGADLSLDLKGKVFLSTKFENYRLNVSGIFGVSPKVGEALPFLFIIDAQKQQDGTFPISLTGRFAKPSIKIGTFTVPL